MAAQGLRGASSGFASGFAAVRPSPPDGGRAHIAPSRPLCLWAQPRAPSLPLGVSRPRDSGLGAPHLVTPLQCPRSPGVHALPRWPWGGRGATPGHARVGSGCPHTEDQRGGRSPRSPGPRVTVTVTSPFGVVLVTPPLGAGQGADDQQGTWTEATSGRGPGGPGQHRQRRGPPEVPGAGLLASRPHPLPLYLGAAAPHVTPVSWPLGDSPTIPLCPGGLCRVPC